MRKRKCSLSPGAASLLKKDLQLKVTSREDLTRGLEKTSTLLLKEEQLTPSHCMKPVKEETVYDSFI